MNRLPYRLLQGAIAGTAATVAMTATARQLARRLPARDRYPLPPREIIGALRGEGRSVADPGRDEAGLANATLIAHALFGAATGALFALQQRRGAGTGAAYGVTVWTASYFGWVPASGLLKPAHRHPLRRNLLMIAAHLVWGGTLALGLRQIEGSVAGELRRGTEALPDLH
ncbi:hypothetical protein ACFQXB_08775 [Plastorhodobacter daqingensis]|uniref:DUF1440 domain-containing protein n=1 Tax=Plastorhodobacter daqingensis TaxID=1387281 RepID=A0ABW2UJQ6_9RHOB